MANWDFIFGDSIGAGIASSQGLSRKLGNKKFSKDPNGSSMVGAKPADVLKYLKEFGAPAFDGKVVILSTGYSNGTSDLATIEEQLKFLSEANAAVMVLGVAGKKAGDARVQKMNLPAGNAKLEELAKKYEFVFAGAFYNTADGVHPKKYADYWNIFHMNIPPGKAPKLSAPPVVEEEKVTDNTAVSTDKPKDESKTESKGAENLDKKDEPVKEPEKIIPKSPFEILGKIIMKKVSGPGEIIGTTEKNIENLDINRGVSFDDITFSAPGDYVVSVTATNEYVDNTYTFDIKILPEVKNVPQEGSKDVGKADAGTRPIIAQVDKPKITIKPIVMDIPPEIDQGANTMLSIGIRPLVLYAGAEIDPKDISYMRLYHDGIVPKCSLMFSDSLGLIKTNLAQDFSTFEVFIDSRTPDLKSIHMHFLIEKFTQDPRTNVFTMNGTLHIPGGEHFYQQNYNSYSGTSLDVLRRICYKLGLGFNTNIDKTDDEMNWVFSGKKTYEVMNEIIKHSYVSEKSFMWGYIDYYYCFNYVDVEKEYQRDNSNDKGVEVVGKNNTAYVPIHFKNESSIDKSVFYFNNFDISNKSTSKSIKTGHKTKVKYYDTNTKEWLVFDVDGNTSDQSEAIPLKGGLYDKNLTRTNIATKFLGYIDTSNVHKNYHYSVILNKRNLDEVQKITAKLSLPNLNLNIYKGMKVKVLFVNQAPSITDPERVNWRLSGAWIVSDIVYVYDGTTFKQTMVCARRDVGKTPLEMKSQIGKLEDDVEDTENPDEDKYNESYEVGKVYRFRDSELNDYYVVVESKTEDGKKMTGVLKTKVAPVVVVTPTIIPTAPPTVIETAMPVAKIVETPVEVVKTAPALNTSPKTILVVGDSQSSIYSKSVSINSAGELVPGGGAITYTWPNFLRKKMTGVTIDVLAVGGKTTSWMLNGDKTGPGLKKYLEKTKKKYDTVIIYAGGNDASNKSIKLDDCITRIQTMVDLSLAHGAAVFVNLGFKFEGTDGNGGLEETGMVGRAFGNWKYMPPTKYLLSSGTTPEGGTIGWKPYVERKIDLQKRLAAEIKKAYFIPIYDLNKQTVDCIHPTQAGHEAATEFIYNAITGVKLINPN